MLKFVFYFHSRRVEHSKGMLQRHRSQQVGWCDHKKKLLVYKLKDRKVETRIAKSHFILSIHFHKFCFRPSMRELLLHEFFAEDTGFKLELVNRDNLVESDDSIVNFRLRITDQGKTRRAKPAHKENEAKPPTPSSRSPTHRHRTHHQNHHAI